jgi:hypothetical protein
MTVSIKALLTVGSLAVSAVFFSALADRHRGDRFVAPPEVVTKECGSCHMVFPPQMLPARSWTAIMDGLDKHFGENAALDPDKKKPIAEWLAANAGDAAGGGHYLRGLMQSQTPLRISETPYWIKEHRKEVSESDYAKPNVKTKANCVACHKDAAKGNFDDD